MTVVYFGLRLDPETGALSLIDDFREQMVIAAIHRLPGRFRYADVARACPGVSRPTIQRAIRKLRDAGEIELLQRGRDAEWRKAEG